MKKLLITGAGGSPATNFVRSLKASNDEFFVVGTDCDKHYLCRAETNEKYLVPPASAKDYIHILNYIIKKHGLEFLHVQNDAEMEYISKNRDQLNIKTFLPDKKTVEICLDKFKSFEKWKKAGIKQPKTMMLNNEEDLKKAFEIFGKKIWIRDITGAGGRGSIAVGDFETAKSWVDFKKGWKKYSAAECLTPDSVTWQSIWKNGELIVAQGRKRLYWELAKLAPSGISGATGGGMTFSDSVLDELAQKTIFAIDRRPNGIFSVDFTYDKNGIPNPTEINIGRFFTTHEFFTKAGLNMPYIFIKLAFNESLPSITKRINPLQDGLVWIRGIDFIPVLTDINHLNMHEEKLKKIKESIKKKEDVFSKHILITGAGGHIGINLLKSVIKKYENICILERCVSKELRSLIKDNNIKLIECDLTNRENLLKFQSDFEKIDIILHLAAYVPKSKDEDNEESAKKVNVSGTMNLVKLLKKGCRFVFISTCETYGIPRQGIIFETHPQNPLSNYGKSKVIAENFLKEYTKENDIQLVILRLTNVYGPGEVLNRAILNFIKKAVNKQNLVIYGNGSDKRDFIYIDDVVNFIIAAIEKGGGVYNIATGNIYSIKEIAKKVIELAGVNVDIEFEKRQKPNVDFVFDISRAKELEYTPKIDIDEGLRREIEWFKNEK
ncbi:NAD-dependent epimerase/dehydratase family protein [Candidatus Woesearchaeota archaeon]|nr:NAD-dependent epimerase/dehydratase family protein [Candidatus Woesearchaeota archaeon]